MFKKLFFKILLWFVFLAIVLSPFWSIFLVDMLAEAKRYPRQAQRQLTYSQRIEQDAWFKGKFKQVGLGGKYYAYFRQSI